MVRIKTNKKGQAAIEFLMTYGWMLLVVLIVGALIFSFVDFGSLLPNKIELNNNIRGDPASSVAYSQDYVNVADRSIVKVMFRYNGAKKVSIVANSSMINPELEPTDCVSYNVTNLDTEDSSITNAETNFLSGQDGLMLFNCSSFGLLKDDVLSGVITINVKDPKSNIEIPSTGAFRIQISQ